MTVTEAQTGATRDVDSLVGALCDALLTARNRDEMRRLLLDLCTPADIRSMADRWQVARLLGATALPYREIHQRTDVGCVCGIGGQYVLEVFAAAQAELGDEVLAVLGFGQGSLRLAAPEAAEYD